MLKNRNIICISSIDWDFVWQGHQEIMSTFAKHGNRVLFIENTGVRPPNFKDIRRLKKRIINWFKSTRGLREEMENLYVYSPIILPFPYSRIARWINKRILISPIKNWMKIMEFYDPIIWTFLPTGTALDIINNLHKKLLVYYCIADFYELAGNHKKVKRAEDELIRKSDLIFAQGKTFYDKCRPLNNNVHIFPFGVNIEAFENFKFNPDKVPLDIKDIKKPIIGYIGGIHRHIDFSLLKFIAENNPDWSVVLVGPVQTDTKRIVNFKNIFLLGKKDFSELPYYINEFDVCIIPYNKSKYSDTVYPTKLNEYHALNKTVVSTDLPEILNFNSSNYNLILVAKTYEEFVDCISKALDNSSNALGSKRIASAKINSWAARIQEMSDLIERSIVEKEILPFNWKKSFLELYANSRTKVLRSIFILLSLYIFFFYTPFIWFLARPLTISQSPDKSDCIVVFAGGVGESGRAGEGYEERVQFAVELFKRDFAKEVIFSSGYAYVYKEPLLMKALAISQGIPSDAVILENKAINTYENVEFTKTILNDKGWRKIILVSSPYHMLRTSLVFKRIAKDIKVIYSPIPNSLFYSRQKRDIYGRRIWKTINSKQIKAIVHEYLGIVYYWLKGWI